MKTVALPDDFDPLAVIVPAPVAPQGQVQQRAPEHQVSQPAVDMQASTAADKPLETTLSEFDAKYFNVADELPTGLAFSAYDKLSVRPYGLPEKYKLGAAKKGGRIKYVVEAVGAAIDRPVMQLPLMDFWFLCYWLRTMSYKKDPLAAEWGCENLDHVRQVYLEEESADTLKNRTIITNTDLQVHPVSEQLRPIAEQLMAGALPIYIHPPTVADFLDRIENGSDWDDEFSYVADIAVYLRSDIHGAKIVDRVKFLRSIVGHPDAEDKMELLKEAALLLQQAGVKDSFKDKCKHCGLEQQVLLEVDLLTFFPV